MSEPPDILKKIIARKHEEIAERSQKVSLSEMVERARSADACRGFVAAMKAKIVATMRRCKRGGRKGIYALQSAEGAKKGFQYNKNFACFTSSRPLR